MNPELFEQEHGITAVLPFIAHFLPNTPVIPLVITQKLPWHDHAQELRQLIRSLMDEDTVLVISSDFSHYLPLDEADAQDELTAQALFSNDLDTIAALKNPSQSDCPGCLWLAVAIANDLHAFTPSTLLHTNSARLLNDPTVRETTSHFAIAFYQNAELNSSDAAFGGDVTVTRAGTGFSLRFAPAVTDFWSGPGLRVVNLEGPLAEECPPNRAQFDFCNSAELWKRVSGLATHWSIRNNHMLDRGLAGLRVTEKVLRKADEMPLTESSVSTSGITLYALTAIMNPVQESQAVSLTQEFQSVIQSLKTSDDQNPKIVIVHYGREYTTLISNAEREYLRSFIDAGADAVIGMHSHVVSDMEMYKGKPIFHSLGNFVFDQRDRRVTATAELVRLRKNGQQMLFETWIGDSRK
jgi:poly-gamma-glutamate synthesis protein (capsule biosynthesis protein)